MGKHEREEEKGNMREKEGEDYERTRKKVTEDVKRPLGEGKNHWEKGKTTGRREKNFEMNNRFWTSPQKINIFMNEAI